MATDLDGDEPLEPRERAALDAWDTPAPPAGFAERMVAARAAADATSGEAAPDVAMAVARRAGAERRRLVRWSVVAAVGVAALGMVLLRSGGPGRATGSAAPSRRESIPLGGRGVAVAEPGATISWTVDGGAAVVAQGGGDVFYRVERGGPFRVETPAGSVRVTGTCFRVEVDMKKHWQALAGAAAGAAIVVTVYEGSVLFAGKAGTEKPVAAGQVLRASADGEAIAVGEAGGDPAAAAAGEPSLAPPADGATREELLARDGAQRAEIARLRSRVAAIGSAPGGGGRGPARGELDANGRHWFDPTKEDLVRFVDECRVRYDMPPVLGTEPAQIGPRMQKEMGLTDEERDVINRILKGLHERVRTQLRALYVEATGDAERADDLSPEAMASELFDKSPPGEQGRINKRIAQERAGLAQPPTNLAALPPIERFMRLQASLGDLTEKEIGEALGPARARALREKNGGWGMRMETAGCNDGSEEEAER
ncbi:MAG TPA: hypothetical protein VMZ28_27675 [Kofleriaceae bacterium]|nr:hypothetical protein [Kofleriaceae bacterium]